jgi:predicted O-methyltransferase YrrM
MAHKTLGLADDLHDYLLRVGVREPPALANPPADRRAARARHADRSGAGAFMALLVELMGANRCIE